MNGAEMIRRAYLIGGVYSKLLEGVGRDIRSWKNFLLSPLGGGWQPEELIDMTGWKRADILEGIQKGKSCDYSCVIFSGHGYMDVDAYGFTSTFVNVNDEVTLSEGDLNPGNPRCLMILDCCRKFPSEDDLVPVMDSFAMEKSASFTRKTFDDEVMKAERGLVTVYAAEEDHSAMDGRSFSRSLIRVASQFREAFENGVLHIDRATELAEQFLVKQQHPVYNGGRRLHHFPFAIGTICH